MKKTILSVGLGLMALAILPSCGGDNTQTKKSPASKNTTPAQAQSNSGAGPNYRFIDTDSIGLKYNLAIDFNEQMIKMQSNLTEEEKKLRNSIQQQANTLQSKMSAVQSRAGSARSEAEMAQIQSEGKKLQSEYEGIQNQSSQAEQKLSQMAADMEKTIATNAKIMQDSLTNFLRDFAAQYGYDAIIVNSAAPYYNPELDVTDEVIKGLNARYNKVKKK